MLSRNFQATVRRNIPVLKQYLPIVQKVHGGHHPEIHEVYDLFNRLIPEVDSLEGDRRKISELFKELREVTDSYKVPKDVCESYEAVYKLLQELDEALVMEKS